MAQASLHQEITSGVKFDSVFKQLKYYHVCQPGLPPCLGHDLFERIVSVALAMYIKHLVTIEKQFTYCQLNRIMANFPYKGSDANNKPCEVRPDGEKLGGHAAQNWCLLRLLPVMVGERIKTPLEDDVWQLCLKLREVVDLICAPKIHTNQVAYFTIFIEEYLQLRSTLFPGKLLKAKHHYLVCYPELILHFGPLFDCGHCALEASTAILSSVQGNCITLKIILCVTGKRQNK